MLDTLGDPPKELSRYEFSLEDGTCLAEASNLASFTKGAGDLHYLSMMRFDVDEQGVFRQSTILFVVDEEDWPELAPVIRASARSFQVDWKRYDRRHPWLDRPAGDRQQASN